MVTTFKKNFIAFPVQAKVLHLCIDEKNLPSGCSRAVIHPRGAWDTEMVWFYSNLEDVKCKKKRSQHRNDPVLFVSVFPRLPAQS